MFNRLAQGQWAGRAPRSLQSPLCPDDPVVGGWLFGGTRSGLYGKESRKAAWHAASLRISAGEGRASRFQTRAYIVSVMRRKVIPGSHGFCSCMLAVCFTSYGRSVSHLLLEQSPSLWTIYAVYCMFPSYRSYSLSRSSRGSVDKRSAITMITIPWLMSRACSSKEPGLDPHSLSPEKQGSRKTY